MLASVPTPAVTAGTDDASVSVFKIDPGNQCAVEKLFGTGKLFSRLRALVISQAPTVSVIFSADQAYAVQSKFKEKASVHVKLFDLFSVGSFDEGYSIDSLYKDKKSGAGTVVLAPPAVVGTVAPEQQLSTVLVASQTTRRPIAEHQSSNLDT